MRRAAALLVIAAGLAGYGCFEPPVQETMKIAFSAGGEAEVEIVTKISTGRDQENAEAAARILEVREAAVRGEDAWTRKLRAAGPVRERYTYDYDHGDLIELTRRAVLEDREGFRRLFEDLPVGAFLYEREGIVTLELIPTGGDRATDRQARLVREKLDEFSAKVADYYKAAADLYGHLRTARGRSRPVFEEIFGEFVAEEEKIREDLDEEEDALVEALQERMSQVFEALTVTPGEAYTLDELSRLLFDPFPAEVEVEAPGEVVEVQGFERRGGGRYAIPPVSLWNALAALEGRWVEPDPVLLYVEAARRGKDQRFDIGALASAPQAVNGVPVPLEVREALVERLRPAEAYRLLWRARGGGEEPERP